MAGYRFLGPTGCPWSERRPLAFHALTCGPYSVEEVLALAARGGRLAPAAEASCAWPAAGRRSRRRSKMTPRDRDGGDAERLFFTPLRPTWGAGRTPYVTLAFDLEALADAGPVSWRPFDLFSPYRKIQLRGRRDGASDEEISADRRRLARSCTLPGAGLATEFARRQAAIARAEAREDRDGAARLAREAIALMEAHRPPWEVRWATPSDVPWTRWFEHGWGTRGLLHGGRGEPSGVWADLGRWQAREHGPEVLLQAAVPLHRALFVAGPWRSPWQPMPR